MAAFVACTSVEGLTGGPSAPSDAGPSSDATLDAPSTDASTEANADGGVARLDCSGDAHWICDDFERDAALDARWLVDDPVGSVRVTTADPTTTSPPTSLAVDLPIDAGSFIVSASRDAFQLAASSLHCRVSFRVAKRGTQGCHLFHVDVGQGTGNVLSYFVDVEAPEVASSGALFFTDYASTADGGGFSSPKPQDIGAMASGWNTLELTLRVGSGAGISASLNRSSTKAFGMAVDLAATPKFGSANVRLGLQCNSAQDWEVLYDDVACDVL